MRHSLLMYSKQFVVLLTVILSFFVVSHTPHTYIQAQSDSEIEYDIAIYGSSLGGISAAITAAENNKKVVLISEHNKIGGQAVEGGLSAMDEFGKPWNKFGLYNELRNYISAKYGLTPPLAGLGSASVGAPATLPSDIEEFFNSKFSKLSSRLTVIRGASIQNVKTENENRVTLTIKEGTGEIRSIHSQYLVDGTYTSKVFEKSGYPLYSGFDTFEETKEPSAFSSEVRDKVINVLGNRVLPISALFSVLDKGYADITIKPTKFGNCTITKGGFTPDSFVIESSSDCRAVFRLLGLSPDTYDVYAYNNNVPNQNFILTYPNLTPMYIDAKVNEGEKFTRLGTFFLNNETKLESKSLKTSDLVLIKKNTLIDGIGKTIENGSGNLEIPVPGSWQVILHSPSPLSSVMIDENSIPLTQVGKNTYSFTTRFDSKGSFQVSVSASEKIELLASLVSGKTPSSSSELLFSQGIKTGSWKETPNSIGTINYSIKGNGEIKWVKSDFEPQTESVLFLNWISTRSLSTKGKVVILDEAGNSITSNDLNLRSKKRTTSTPVLSFSCPTSVCSIILQNFSSDSFVFENAQLFGQRDFEGLFATSSNKSSTLTASPGLYDIWVSSPSSDVTNSSFNFKGKTYQFSPSLRYKPLDRVFLPQNFSIKDYLIGCESCSIIATPLNRPNIFRFSSPSISTELKIDNWQRIAGYFDAVIETDSNVTSISVMNEEFEMTKSADYSANNKSYFSISELLVKDKNWNVNIKTNSPSRINAYFYEQIPKEYDTDMFMYIFPILRPKSQDSGMTFMNFRNIITQENLIKQRMSLPLSGQIFGNNSLGVSNVSMFHSDYGPITPENVGKEETFQNAKHFSYLFYYWLRNDSINTTDSNNTLGCVEEAVLCSSKRIQAMVGLYEKPGMFAEEPYFRETKRIHPLKQITEKDVTFDYVYENYNPNDCVAIRNKACILKRQMEEIAPDSLIPVFYMVDFHKYFSRDEIHSGLMAELTAKYGRSTLTGSSPLLWDIPSTPTSVTLGSLLPSKKGNIFPSTLNFGTSQIANSALRVHTVDIAIGEAIGFVLSFAIDNNITPYTIYESPELLNKLQIFILNKGIPIFPIDNIPSKADLLWRNASQLAISNNFLTPEFVMNSSLSSRSMRIANENRSLRGEDLQFIQELLPEITDPATLKNKDLLYSILPNLLPQSIALQISLDNNIGIVKENLNNTATLKTALKIYYLKKQYGELPINAYLFKDVPLENQYSAHIYSLRSDKILGGYPDNTFRPESTISNFSVFSLISSRFKIPENSSCQPYSNLPPSSQYFVKAMSLKCSGIHISYSGNSFEPGKEMTREEAVQLVIRAARFSKTKSADTTIVYPLPSNQPLLSDVAPSNPYKEYIYIGISNNLIQPKSDSRFEPNKPITRGELAMLIDKAYQEINVK